MKRWVKVLALVVFTISTSGFVVAEAALPLFGNKVELDTRISDSLERTEASAALTHYIVALIHDSSGDKAGAVEEYKKALRYDKDQPVILCRLGAALLYTGSLDEALKYLDKATEVSPEKVQPYLLRAVLFANQNEHDKSEKELKAALKREPKNKESILNMLADMYIMRGNFTEAAKIYTEIAKIREESEEYFNLGVLYTKLKDLKRAEASFEKAVELDANHIKAQMVLGNIYQVEGDYARAIEQYEKVIKIDPVHLAAHTRLSQVYHQLELYDKALEVNERIMEIAPEEVQSYLRSSGIYLALEKNDRAREVLEKAREAGLDSSAISGTYGYILYEEGKFTEAAEKYRQALKKADRENKGRYRFNLAMALYKDEQKAAAIEILEKMLASDEKQPPEVYNFLGYAYAEKGINLERAVELVKKALKEDPENGAYLDSLGWAYYQMGKYDEAEELLLKAYERMPEEAVIAEHLAKLFERTGSLEKALKYWEKAVKLEEENEEYIRRKEKLKEELRTER